MDTKKHILRHFEVSLIQAGVSKIQGVGLEGSTVP